MRLKWFIFLVCLLVWGGVQVHAIEIFYPADKTSFTKSNYLIAFMGAPLDIDSVNIIVNGVESGYMDISGEDYRTYFADKIILEPQFDIGENTIVVRGSTSMGDVREAKATVYYLGDDPMASPPKGYTPFVMHQGAREEKCQSCHDMRPDRVALSEMSADSNPCASCHQRMLSEPYVHGPAGVFRCTYCHRGANEKQKYLAPQDGDLCVECHQEKIREFNSRKYVHGPVAVGLCLACHDPHSSSFPAQMRGATNEICLGCHSTVTKSVHVGRGVGGGAHPLSGVDDPLRRGKKLSCASCHDPHSGSASSLFIRGATGRFSLCQHCHQK